MRPRLAINNAADIRIVNTKHGATAGIAPYDTDKKIDELDALADQDRFFRIH